MQSQLDLLLLACVLCDCKGPGRSLLPQATAPGAHGNWNGRERGGFVSWGPGEAAEAALALGGEVALVPGQRLSAQGTWGCSGMKRDKESADEFFAGYTFAPRNLGGSLLHQNNGAR